MWGGGDDLVVVAEGGGGPRRRRGRRRRPLLGWRRRRDTSWRRRQLSVLAAWPRRELLPGPRCASSPARASRRPPRPLLVQPSIHRPAPDGAEKPPFPRLLCTRVSVETPSREVLRTAGRPPRLSRCTVLLVTRCRAILSITSCLFISIELNKLATASITLFFLRYVASLLSYNAVMNDTPPY